jgi:ADP-ribose pyrophosphatase YjhB (NUDIX family)
MASPTALTDIARRLAGLAQTGLHYAADAYDVARYEEIQAIAAQLLAGGDHQRMPEVLEILTSEGGHATPKVDVRGLCRWGEDVLLVRERIDGRWTLPGGWAEPDLTPSESVVKEVREEAGFAVSVTRLLGCFDRRLQVGVPPHPFPIYKLIFACDVEGAVDRGDTPDADETTDVGWFPPDGLPPLSRGRTHPEQLRRVLAVLADPSGQALFD